MELDTFIEEWTEDPAGAKEIFVGFRDQLASLDNVEIQFNARPGISYSMRGVKTTQDRRPVFVLADVIDDDPADRWLSVCFYGDSITDPDELGDMVPGGLLGEDGHCFDVEDADAAKYVAERIAEGYASQ